MIYSYKTSGNRAVIDTLFALAEDNKFEVCPIYSANPTNWNYLMVDTKRNEVFGSGAGENSVDLETMVEVLSRYMRFDFKLSDTYTAIVDRKTRTVQVGCQTFSFDLVQELANKLNDQ